MSEMNKINQKSQQMNLWSIQVSVEWRVATEVRLLLGVGVEAMIVEYHKMFMTNIHKRRRWKRCEAEWCETGSEMREILIYVYKQHILNYVDRKIDDILTLIRHPYVCDMWGNTTQTHINIQYAPYTFDNLNDRQQCRRRKNVWGDKKN